MIKNQDTKEVQIKKLKEIYKKYGVDPSDPDKRFSDDEFMSEDDLDTVYESLKYNRLHPDTITPIPDSFWENDDEAL
jgi:hypothetical protein